MILQICSYREKYLLENESSFIVSCFSSPYTPTNVCKTVATVAHVGTAVMILLW